MTEQWHQLLENCVILSIRLMRQSLESTRMEESMNGMIKRE